MQASRRRAPQTPADPRSYQAKRPTAHLCRNYLKGNTRQTTPELLLEFVLR